MTDPITFALAVVALLAVPGPTNTLLATAGGLVGVRRAIRLIPAELAGYLLAIGLVTAILRPLLSAYPQSALALRVVGGAVLVTLAIGLWRNASAAPHLRGGAIRPAHVFLATLLNPKAVVFALGIIPHLGGPTPSRALPYLAAFAGLLVAIACAWASLGSLLHGGARPRLSPAIIRRGGAVVLMVFATVLLASAVLAD